MSFLKSFINNKTKDDRGTGRNTNIKINLYGIYELIRDRKKNKKIIKDALRGTKNGTK